MEGQMRGILGAADYAGATGQLVVNRRQRLHRGGSEQPATILLAGDADRPAVVGREHPRRAVAALRDPLPVHQPRAIHDIQQHPGQIGATLASHQRVDLAQIEGGDRILDAFGVTALDVVHRTEKTPHGSARRGQGGRDTVRGRLGGHRILVRAGRYGNAEQDSEPDATGGI
jgi:hypothetical protein